jgi:hypothetical protein
MAFMRKCVDAPANIGSATLAPGSRCSVPGLPKPGKVGEVLRTTSRLLVADEFRFSNPLVSGMPMLPAR